MRQPAVQWFCKVTNLSNHAKWPDWCEAISNVQQKQSTNIAIFSSAWNNDIVSKQSTIVFVDNNCSFLPFLFQCYRHLFWIFRALFPSLRYPRLNQDRHSVDRFPEIIGEAKVLLDEWVDHRHFEVQQMSSYQLVLSVFFFGVLFFCRCFFFFAGDCMGVFFFCVCFFLWCCVFRDVREVLQVQAVLANF